MLTQATTLKELCEYQLAESVTPGTVPLIVDAALRTHAQTLLRYCERYRERIESNEDPDLDEDEDKRRRPRQKGDGRQAALVRAA